MITIISLSREGCNNVITVRKIITITITTIFLTIIVFSSSGNLMTMDSDQKKMCRSVHLWILRLELQVKKSGKKSSLS